jgi:outer membrane receptor protein involved in Fe transport
MQRLLSAALASAAALASNAALAQSSDTPAKPQPKMQAGSEVVVTGKAAVSVSIDRRSYSVAGDLRTTTGSVADALRNVPSVEVDPQGNVSLRGDPSVTILVDGHPAAQFEGSTRADALQALPADRIDRIEVMTNPSAEFTSQGTGGVINIVTKSMGGAAPTATVRGALGTSGRVQAAITAADSKGPLSLSADASFRRDPRTLDIQLDTLAGGLATHYQMKSTGRADVANAGAKLQYEYDPKTRVTGEARLLLQSFSGGGQAQSLSGPSASALTSDYVRTIGQVYKRDSYTLGAGFQHSFPGEQHQLTFDFQHQYMPRSDATGTADLFRRSASAPAFEDIKTNWPLNYESYKLLYRRPMAAEGKLVVGYDRLVYDLVSNTSGLRGDSAASAVADPSLADRYRVYDVQQSFYGTYQQPIGSLTILAGLRIETIDATLHSEGRLLPRISSADVDPSLNLSYQLDQQSKLTFAYSRRIDKPYPIFYNPALIYADPITFREGNPGLQPAKTDSFEAAYELKRGGSTWVATAYYRRNMEVLTFVLNPLGGGLFAIQNANAAQGRNGGFELVADGPLFGKLRYSFSGDAYYSELQNPGERLSGVVLNGRANLDWSPDEADLLQLNLVAAGRAIYPQGYTEPRLALNLGYRRHLTGSLYLTATGDDVLGGFGRFRTLVDTPSVTDHVLVHFNGPALTVSLSYTFGGPGGGKKPPPSLEYGGAAATP